MCCIYAMLIMELYWQILNEESKSLSNNETWNEKNIMKLSDDIYTQFQT